MINSPATNDAVVAGLTALRTTAPDVVLPRVLAATGAADRYTMIDGPAGNLFIAWNDTGVSAVAPATGDAEFAEMYDERVGRHLVRVDNLPARLLASVQRVLRTGKLGRLPVDLTGLTPFQQRVLRAASSIPRGELRSYAWIAREIGSPSAARAVGSALNRNPVPVLIPCHRVGRSDGTIGEYAFGPRMKRDLLRHEGLDPDIVDGDAARGVRLVGSDTTHIYCTPTCRNARRITDAHRVEFRSGRAAADTGYRACKVCRPAVAA